MKPRSLTLQELLRERQALHASLTYYESVGYLYLTMATVFGAILAALCGYYLPLNWHSWGQAVITGLCVGPVFFALCWLSHRVSCIKYRLYEVVKLIEDVVRDYP